MILHKYLTKTLKSVKVMKDKERPRNYQKSEERRGDMMTKCNVMP
jgi:hypothetical protein